ncbi:sensor histidine kinase [Actinomadura parmotrematis]|uniref:histidine kinase n=1 Tax=Actinomadura parmotrematis TaxID=2864039 RepID=A0ABS7G0I3_9ACTN|nr:sensor histidine kinase [Actinomadura parmotrematis]MBW8486198.1 nitrate- and nitrite sensing domain-containing protein [Actinomadura parmotrematis]
MSIFRRGRYGGARTWKAPWRAGGERRRRSVWFQIAVLLVVPLVSLVAIWSFAANLTLDNALSKDATQRANDKVGLPGALLANGFQAERALSVVFLTAGEPGRAELAEQRGRTDAAVAAFRRTALSAGLRSGVSADIRGRLDEVAAAVARLAGLRAAVDRGALGWSDAAGRYDELVDATQHLFSGLVIVKDIGVFQAGRALINIGWAREYLMREDCVMIAARALRNRLTPDERAAFGRWAGAGRQFYRVGTADLHGPLSTGIAGLGASDGYRRYRALEDAIVASGGRPTAAQAAEWEQLFPPLNAAWARALSATGAALTEQAEPIGQSIARQLVLAGGLGLVAVLVSIALSVLFGRGLGRELRELQRAAQQLAEERLPSVVARLRRGERVDVGTEAPPLSVGRTAEVGRVADALSQVQRTAVASAIGEADLRQGINRVFLNLAWRSQSLLHRQLRLLDAMERRADSEVLEDLFRLDHLTTRMRRHAEGLVILSGASPGRGWSRPLPMVDVLRAAVAEVEDYTRVEVSTGEEIALVGGAAADIVHLLAELVENATMFSPPNTQVIVRGEPVGKGYAIEVVDRGIGLDEAERERLNRVLARPPEFDFADTDRLGLFVVARLAARRNVRVGLQPSLYGGTTAIVLLPHALVVSALDADPDEAEPPAEARELPWRQRPDGAGERPAGQEPPEPSRAPDAEAAPLQASAPPAAGKPVLARRKRMENLVPQLRASGAQAVPSAEEAGRSWAEAPPGRAEPEPERTRDLWGALQGGWERGRDQDAPDGAAGEGTS